jgi:hypothetical protein
MPVRPPVFFPLALGVLFLGAVPYAAIHASKADSQQRALARWDDNAAREERNHSSIAIILGEFRANFSDLMFVKTERYLHSGIGYKPHLNTDAMAATGAIEDRNKGLPTTSTLEGEALPIDQQLANDTMKETAAIPVGQVMVETEEEHSTHSTTETQANPSEGEHDHVPTLIREEHADFRGFLGDLEREIKPWRDPSLPHQHTAGTELLPWFRLATLGNPQNERAYMIGTWWLKTLKTPVQMAEGLKFIDEGILNNPKSFALILMRGYLLRELGQPAEAGDSFLKAADLVFHERPADGVLTRDWNESREELAVGAWTMAILTVRDKRGERAALEYARRLYQRCKAPPVERLVNSLQAAVATQTAPVSAPTDPAVPAAPESRIGTNQH